MDMLGLESNYIARFLATHRIGCLVMVSLCVINLVGCAKFDLRRNIPWQETSDKPVRSVVAFWTEAVIERTSGPPYRGFGGRLLFYPADMSQPVKVQGTVVVYAFDEDLPPPENLKPVRKYVFTNEQLQDVYSESKLGPSYNLLIPWEEFSPQARRISLIVRYIPDNGPSVVSEQVKVFLPGLDNSMLLASHNRGTSQISSPGAQRFRSATSVTPQQAAPPAVESLVRPVDYQQVTDHAAKATSATNDQFAPASTAKPGENKRRMETLTLNISPRLGRASPSPLSNGSESAGKANAGRNLDSPQDAENLLPSSDQTSRTTSTPWNSHSYGQPITPPSRMTVPPNPGQLIKDLNQQPPTRFEPYQPLVPRAEVSPAPIVHPQWELSP